MAVRRRSTIALAVVAVVLLVLGLGVSFVVSDALGLRTESVDIPTENLVAAPASSVVLPPAFTSIDVASTLRTDLAVEELRDAVASAAGTQGQATLTVSFGSPDDGDDSYTLSGTPTALQVTAPYLAGDPSGRPLCGCRGVW